MNTQIAGIVYGFDGSVIQEYEAKLAEAVANHKTAQKMLKTKLEQLDIIDAAINTAYDKLDNAIADAQNESDLNKFKNIVGFESDEPNQDLSVTLWEMHNQIEQEINGKSTNIDDRENPDQDWREIGLKQYLANKANEVSARQNDILLYIQQLLGASGAMLLKDDTGNDMAQINKLIKKLNKLLAKYDLAEFDPNDFDPNDNTKVSFDYDEPAEDFDGTEEHEHDTSKAKDEPAITEETTFVKEEQEVVPEAVQGGGEDEHQEPQPELYE